MVTRLVNYTTKVPNNSIEHATKPTESSNKVSWSEDDESQIYLTRPIHPSLLVIGYSIVARLSCYRNVWKRYFKHFNTSNCDIYRDKTKHVL